MGEVSHPLHFKWHLFIYTGHQRESAFLTTRFFDLFTFEVLPEKLKGKNLPFMPFCHHTWMFLYLWLSKQFLAVCVMLFHMSLYAQVYVTVH